MINHFKSINKKSPEEALESIILTDVTHIHTLKKNFNNTCKNLKNYENTNINIFKNIKI